ncbi:GNAT family N-acetyltransferase [Clostridium arbusti]|uniref:GNAT family N-acetyltransferase n=1 Tax=Clostridium arbusti TaxID=1137848 RepID=UPI00028A0CBA|nr:GNAT family N-acetyltransferase [Clostridium arbusti]
MEGEKLKIMDNIIIEKCSLKDIKKLKEIGERTFYETFYDENLKENIEDYIEKNFSYEQLENEIKNNNSRFYMVQNDNEIIAYMKLNFIRKQTNKVYDKSLEIQRIYVAQEYKSKHIGKKLIEKAVKIAKSNNQSYIWLGVWEKNINAIGFYEKQGFKKYSSHIFKLGQDEQIDNLMKLIL